MTANIKSIELWEDNPDKSRISNVVRINFKFPCTWTILSLDNLKQVLREWIRGEEMKYPQAGGYMGRWMLFSEIKEIFYNRG